MTAAAYQQRKGQQCTRAGCDQAPGEDSNLCAPHNEDQKKRRRDSMRRTRKRRRRLRVCVHCGGPRPKRAASCLACRIARGRVTEPGVARGVDKAERIAAATRTHADGRTRYHASGKRGSQPAEKLDAEDLEWARSAIVRGEAGIDLLRSVEVKLMPKIQRDDVRAAALGQLIRAQGHIGDVLQRHGGKSEDRTRELQAKVDQLEERLTKAERVGHAEQRHGRRDGE